MNSEPAKCDWIFLLPGFLHIIMGAQAALRDVDWHGPGPGGAWMAHDHGWEIESHQRAFAASKDAHKATDGVELEPDAYCGAVAACYLKAAACPGEPAGKDRRTRCPTGFNLPAAPTAAAYSALKQALRAGGEVARLRAWMARREREDEDFAGQVRCYRDGFLPVQMKQGAAREDEVVHPTTALKAFGPLWFAGNSARAKLAHAIGHFLLHVHRMRNPLPNVPGDAVRMAALLEAAQEALPVRRTPGSHWNRDEDLEALHRPLGRHCPNRSALRVADKALAMDFGQWLWSREFVQQMPSWRPPSVSHGPCPPPAPRTGRRRASPCTATTRRSARGSRRRASTSGRRAASWGDCKVLCNNNKQE